MNPGSADLAGGTVLQRSDRVLVAHLQGESVLLDPDAGRYYALNPVGSAIWSLLERPLALATLAELVVAQFAVAPEVAWRDCVTFVEELKAHGLVELQAR
ncbi:MAG: PqqD family protein [Acidobacteria bacterium]|nr:PqqD family protein [Acidobacteriota bacterium]